MAVQTHARVSVEEFEKIAALPENADRALEYIGGEIVEVVSNSLSSQIGINIGAEIRFYLKANDIGYLTGEQGGYRVSGEDYMPDVGFISKARHPKRPRETWVPIAPDLAVEVVSPTDRPKDIGDKIANYLAAGTVAWYFYPEAQEVKVYQPGKPVKTLTINDTLDGGKVLPGFKVALKDIFPADD
ncbi:MAG TPA: Uma2 family endonuclease [Aggregatilineales bacterium]|nr:Uma2 family endonuclease [Aggregatilineales bacterium]